MLRNVNPFVHAPVIGEPQTTSGSSSRGPQQHSISMSFPEPAIHPAVAPQLPIGTYSLQAHPSARYSASSSSPSHSGLEQARGQKVTMTIPIPSMSGTVPMAMAAPAVAQSFSSMHVPVSTSDVCIPVVRPWDAAASTAADAFASAAPRLVPAPSCRCSLRAHPFVHVDDTIEWVRPDLMRMFVWFNWSPNAEAEAETYQLQARDPRRG
ncbi:hypothetical protein V8E53_014854 [Lactarius tabidus]